MNELIELIIKDNTLSKNEQIYLIRRVVNASHGIDPVILFKDTEKYGLNLLFLNKM